MALGRLEDKGLVTSIEESLPARDGYKGIRRRFYSATLRGKRAAEALKALAD